MLELALTAGARIADAALFFDEAKEGVGGEVAVDVASFRFEWKEKRLFRSSVRHSEGGVFLPFSPNCIAFVAQQGRDVISSKFSGCSMALYDDANGVRKVAHVHRPGAVGEWAKLKAQTGFTVVSEFRPTSHVDDRKAFGHAVKIGGNAGPEVLGLITGAGDCYALGVTRLTTSGVTTMHVHTVAKVVCPGALP